MNTLLTITNLLFILIFARAFSRDNDSAYFFNPVLLTTNKVTDKILDFTTPLFPGLRKTAVSIIVLVFLLAFRGALMTSAGHSNWSIIIGSTLQFFPRPGWVNAITFSFLDFAAFLIHFWGMSLFISVISGGKSYDRIRQAIDVFARPVSLTPVFMQLIAVFVANAVLVYVLCNYTEGILGSAARAPFQSAFKTDTSVNIISTYAGITLFSIGDILSFVRQALILTIFASLFAAIFSNRSMSAICMELQNALMGRFARRQLSVGLFDFTPVIFFIVLNIVYGVFIFIVTIAMKHFGVIATGALATQAY